MQLKGNAVMNGRFKVFTHDAAWIGAESEFVVNFVFRWFCSASFKAATKRREVHLRYSSFELKEEVGVLYLVIW